MNIEEKISRIVDSIYDYAMHGTGGKQLADYKNELTTLLQQEREKAVREFVFSLEASLGLNNGVLATGGEDFEFDFNEQAEQFLKESEDQDDNR